MVRKFGRVGKRVFDFCCALCLLLLFSPILLMTMFFVRKQLGSPVLFTQERPGLHGRIFTLYKLRTMTGECDEHGVLLPDELRLTPFGQKLRTYSLDEWPQLFNVLRGDLSLVGPRPLLVEYLPLYNAEQARRHEVRPGITGWAQVNGRNAIGWEEKFALDVWYVDHRSFWLDLKILLLTVRKVFRSEGVNQKGQATMSRFIGN